jgi:hypothetical protein
VDADDWCNYEKQNLESVISCIVRDACKERLQ